MEFVLQRRMFLFIYLEFRVQAIKSNNDKNQGAEWKNGDNSNKPVSSLR